MTSPTPSSALNTHRPDLAASFQEFDLEMSRMGFVAHKVLPVFEAAVSSGNFGKITVESLLQARNTNRSAGGGYSRGKWTFTTDSWTTEEHGAEEPIDDRTKRAYANYFDAEMVCTGRARDAVLRNAEQRAAALIFDTAAITPTAVSTEWSTVGSATPVTDVEAEIKAFRAAIGFKPNAILLPWVAFRNLRNNAQILDRIKYSGIHDPTPEKITAEVLAQVFDLKYVFVPDAMKNTADSGQDVTFGEIWDDEYVAILRVAETNDIQEPCVGRTFHWSEDGSQILGTVETYRDEPIRADVVRVRHDVDEKRLYTQCCRLLSNITA